MAYAALVSLIRVLENTQTSSSNKHRIPYEKQQIESLVVSLRSIVDHFRVHSWQRESDDVRRLEAEIRDAAYKAENLVESRVSEHFYFDGWFTGASRRQEFKQNLRTVTEEMDSIKQKVISLQQDSVERHRGYSSAGPSNPPRDLKVGVMDELNTLRAWLTDYQGALRVIPIVGMVGSGKTTLARQLYEDPLIEGHFDMRAWVTVSSNYQPKKVLLELLRCMKVLTEEMYDDDYDLRTDLHRCLYNRRYLVVVDDVWDTDVWENIKGYFPECHLRSRILLTTRESRVADVANSDKSQHHQKRLLNGKESWDLMRHIVFGSQYYNCPRLEEVGKKIAKRCRGLPFWIVIISGILSNDSRTKKETWESVAENIKSILDEQCSDVLSLMYARLPHHLKACLLYLGVFPEDFEISVSKLIKLWISEGFLEPSGSESLEEVGENYLSDLIARQLVLISKRSSGKVKTCHVHDLILEFCLRKAREENFFHSTRGSSEAITDPRRISCPSDFLGENIPKETFSFVRSLISVSIRIRDVPGANDAIRHCKLLRVLDTDKVRLKQFPPEISELVCLGYVSLCCEEEDLHIPKSVSKSLQNLETLIVLQSSSKITTKNKGGPGVHLPVELWSMPKLRHLKFRKCYLPSSFWNNSILENLQTLSKLSSSSCNVNFFQRIPNLKKLGVYVENSGSPFCLGNVGNLPKLEKLEVVVVKGSVVSIPESFTLPQNLKNLTLDQTKLPWKDMSIVGSLPILQELKLVKNAFQGPEWEPVEGQFCHLKSLTLDELDLEYWEAVETHFPKLEQLTIWECGKLKEISSEIGRIDTLELIELDDASPHAVTWAKEIQQHHQELETERFQVCFYNIWSNEYQQRKDANEAFERRKEEERREEERRKRDTEEEKATKRRYAGASAGHYGARPARPSEYRPSFDHNMHRPSFDHGTAYRGSAFGGMGSSFGGSRI